MSHHHIVSASDGKQGHSLRITPAHIHVGGAGVEMAALAFISGPVVNEAVPVQEVVWQDDGVSLTGSSAEFEGRMILRERHGHAVWYEVELELVYRGAVEREIAVRVCLEMHGSGKPTWLIPGVFYHHNRFEHSTRMYPRYDYCGGNPQEMVSDSWAFRADRAALPAIFAWNDELSAALCTNETSSLGLNGVGFCGNTGGTSLWLDFPYRETPVVFDGEPEPQPADCPLFRCEPGTHFVLPFSLYLGPPDLHAYNPFVRDMYRLHRDLHGLRPWVSPAQAAALTAHGMFRWHYNHEHQALYETAAFDREFNNNVKGLGDRPHMHVGWVSGALCAYALMTYGREIDNWHYSTAGIAVLDKIAAGLAPAGVFWGQWTLAGGWSAGWNRNRHWIHGRTIGEATLFLLRALRYEEGRGVEHSRWREAIRSNLAVVLQTQREDGNYGTYYHSESGDVEEWDGAGGLIWIPVMLEAASHLEDERYRASARRAGSYYGRFVTQEFIYGAPEDVHLSPSSEDAYNAVMAYVHLYESDGDPGWLDRARSAADWMMTFRWMYNLTFPRYSLLAQYDFRSRGADQASPSNQHLHNYGLICLPEMLRLWQYTGDDYYLQRTRDNLACFLQFVARDDGDFNAYRGMVTERYYNTRCFQPKGMMLTLSHAWSVGMVLYASQVAVQNQQYLNL